MRQVWKYSLLGVVLAGMGVSAQAGVRHELRLLQTQEARLQRGLNRTLRDRSQALDALRRSEDAVAHASQAYLRIKRRELRLQADAANLVAQERALRRREGQEQARMARQLVSAYVAGRAGALELFFDQKDPTRLARMMSYYGYILRLRAHHLKVARTTLAAIAKTEDSLRQKTVQLQQLAQTKALEQGRLQAALDRRARAVQGLNGRARTGRARLLALRQRARRLQGLLEGLRRLPHVPNPVPSLHGPFARFRGRLPLPIPAPFAALRTSAPTALSRWSGVLIPGRLGEEVRAVFPGRVVYANWLRGYGLLLILENGDGYMTLYGHNQTLLKHVGDFVRGGEVIATVGNSGGFSRPGLYFDVSHNGRPLNPLAWLAH